MTRATPLAEVLTQFAHALPRSAGPGDTARELAARARSLVAPAGVAVAVPDGAGLRLLCALPEPLAAVARREHRDPAGPTRTAARTGRTVLPAGRPATGAGPAADQPLLPVAAVPLGAEPVLGVLTVYGEPAGDRRDALAAVEALAAVAAAQLGTVRELQSQRRTAEQLQRALDSRVVIEQAKGVLAASRGIGVEDAFALLRRYATDHRLPLHQVAAAVVRDGLRP